jgi:rod shape-determining protein MreC
VKENPRVISQVSQPIKVLSLRFAYAGLIVVAFALMILGKIDVVLMEHARTRVTNTVAPILDAISRPFASALQFALQVESLWDMYEDNQALRIHNERLFQWHAVALQLEAENNDLRDLLHFTPDPGIAFISGRVIADTGGAYAHSLLLNAGSRDGIQKGQAVVTGEGLVGRIASVGSRSSRILLISDLNSRIPVIVEPGRIRAMLAGDNTAKPRLSLLAPGSVLSPGDMVMTSGHGGAFPVGLAVGLVSAVNENGVTVQPFVKRNRLDLVRIIDFGLAGILRAEPIEERPIALQSEPVTFIPASPDPDAASK